MGIKNWAGAVALSTMVSPAFAALKPGAVIYGVVPPFFGERALQSVTERMAYLERQGVDAIWLPPITASDDIGKINYSVTNYFELRPDYGTEDDLHELVQEAHRRRIKVLLDFVPNHSSRKHPFFLDAEARGRLSPFFDFYQRDAAGNPVYYFNWSHLPNFNYDNPAVQEHIEKAFLHWVEKFDVDGYRVDVAWGIRERKPDFWPRLRESLNRVKPGVVMLAEASARDTFYLQNGFDFTYDWTDELGHWAWENIFEDPGSAGPKLARVTEASHNSPERIVRFLNNNDTGKRFITRFGLELTRIAAVLQHTLPGIPIVYTGDEVGAEFEPYETYSPIDWTDRHGLEPLYRKLARLREQQPALWGPGWEAVLADDGVFAYLRWHRRGRQLLVLLNFGEARRVSIPAERLHRLGSGQLRDLLSGSRVNTICANDEQAYCFDLEARSAQVLMRSR